MTFPKSKRKRYIVDQLPYTACITEHGISEDGGIQLGVAIKADYGLRSLCLIRGTVNRSYWMDYPDFDPNKSFSITPRVVCDLIRFAIANVWSPATSKSQMEFRVDNQKLSSIIQSDGSGSD
ncbi:MAG: hypothetical protein AAF939_02785 [Planctomycetota bacterium]